MHLKVVCREGAATDAGCLKVVSSADLHPISLEQWGDLVFTAELTLNSSRGFWGGGVLCALCLGPFDGADVSTLLLCLWLLASPLPLAPRLTSATPSPHPSSFVDQLLLVMEMPCLTHSPASPACSSGPSDKPATGLKSKKATLLSVSCTCVTLGHGNCWHWSFGACFFVWDFTVLVPPKEICREHIVNLFPTSTEVGLPSRSMGLTIFEECKIIHKYLVNAWVVHQGCLIS